AQDDVVRLEIAMGHARAMHRGEREGYMREHIEAARPIERLHCIAQGRPIDELFDDQRIAALNWKNAIDPCDARMIEPRCGGDLDARRVEQLLAPRRVIMRTTRGALDRDFDAELEIVGAKHLAECARPKRTLPHETA